LKLLGSMLKELGEQKFLIKNGGYMKKSLLTCLFLLFSIFIFTSLISSKGKGEKCLNNSECDFGTECNDGVCVNKKEFDFGGSGKTGNPCNIDADCIGSGKCVEGSFGKKYCSGN
jgi:hypothetical protein